MPLVLQTVLIFFVAYGWARWWQLPHDIAAPAGMIGASNFFELAVAVAISLFGLRSGAAMATVVGVLVEVPVMLTLVRIANNTRKWFAAYKSVIPGICRAKRGNNRAGRNIAAKRFPVSDRAR